MSEIARFKSEEGEVLVEVDEELRHQKIQRASKGEKVIVDAAEDIDSAIRSVLPAVDRLFEALKGMKPDATELEFGIKLSAEAGALIAKTAGEAHFTVTLKWEDDAAVATAPDS